MALWALAVACMVLGVLVLTGGNGPSIGGRGIIGALSVAFGLELFLALCYVAGTR